MICKRNISIMLSCVLIICFISIICVKQYNYKDVSARIYHRPSIIIDAGHGGFDGGAVASDGTVEKDINLKISLVLSALMKQSGFDVIMTRENDISTDDVETDKISTKKKSDMKNRLKLMKNHPDSIFVSIHLNKFTTSAANGCQIFYSQKNSESKELGECIQKAVVDMLQPKNNRVNKQATSNTYLLYNATVPAVLVECGFLSNKSELEKLKDEVYQQKMAFCIYCGILNYYQK